MERPYKFDKPTVFITSRVHPGETPASYVLNGILSFLTNEKSEQAKILRDNFVFKIIPMLNPDGVYRGYYRLDTNN
jgi:murein tripeptide amidase MpaA